MGKSLAEKCLEYRSVYKLNQTQMAERCGVHLQTIHNLETGKSLRATTLLRIARVLNGVEWNDREGIQTE